MTPISRVSRPPKLEGHLENQVASVASLGYVSSLGMGYQASQDNEEMLKHLRPRAGLLLEAGAQGLQIRR